MYTVTKRVNQQTFEPYEFKTWQSAYKYLRVCKAFYNFNPNPKIEHYSLIVHNASGIEIQSLTIV